jgi:electron transport complex protein RnfG
MSEEIKSTDIEDVQSSTIEKPKKVKKGLNESVKIVLAITILALVSALLLSVINNYTKVDKEKALMDKISSVYSVAIVETIDVDKIIGYSPVEKTQIEKYVRAEDGAHIVVAKSKKGYSAAGVSLIVVIKDDKILKIEVFSHSETPGLGTKAFAEEHFNKYIGLSINELNVDQFDKKTCEQFIVISATRSSGAVYEAILAAVRVVKYYGA